MAFKPENPDFCRSPYTGLTREHWLQAAQYMMDGIFQHVKTMDSPVLVPRLEREITYPNSHTPAWKVQAELFEGLARSFFIAAPLIQARPEAEAGGILLRDYYKKQILRAVTPSDSHYVLGYEDMAAMDQKDKAGEPLATYQQTVETCGLVIGLWASRNQIWDTYTQEEKDQIAGFLAPYACSNTVPQNWRLFNMLDLAFLHMNGYAIDQDIMRHHASVILNYYGGDGWFRDGHGFDYYSAWAFQLYAPLWCLWYGYEKEPWLAQKFQQCSQALMEHYDRMFDQDGWVNMWGRSGIYRNAAVSAFIGNLLLPQSQARPGLARRICSGALMQFLGRDDWLYQGAPVLGFYRPFLPLIQSYSCAESPLWLGKAFLCLCLPPDHPFWTAREENGVWEEMGQGETKETVLNGPGLALLNHKDNGTTELRSGKVVRRPGDANGICCYAKLAYSTRYPWEALTTGAVQSQLYQLEEADTGNRLLPNGVFWAGSRDGVLYRRGFFQYDSQREEHWHYCVDLADFSVKEGILRADRLRTYRSGYTLTLGSYGFPADSPIQVRRLERQGVQAIAVKGNDSQGREKQMVMTIFDGWEKLELYTSAQTNPDSSASVIIGASMKRNKLYGYEPALLVSQVLTRESWEDFSEDQIFSVQSISYTDPQGCGAYGPVEIQMKDGRRMNVDFFGIEGRLEL